MAEPEPPALPGTAGAPTPAAAAAAAEPAKPTRLRRLTKVGLAVAAPFVLLAIAEALLRAGVPPPPPPPLEWSHPLYRRVYVPSTKVPRRDPRTAALVPLETNVLGFRGRSVRGVEKARDAFRIAFLGGAPLEGAGLVEEDTAPGRLELAINSRRKIDDDLRVESLNLAAEGQGFAEGLGVLVHRALPLRPDVIVVVPGPEDVVRVGRPGFDPTRAADRHAGEGGPASLGDMLEARLLLFGVARRIFAPKPVRNEIVDPRERRRAVPFTGQVDLSVTVPYLRRYLHLMALVARDAKTSLALATIPTLLREGLTTVEDQRLRVGYVDDQWNLDATTLREGIKAWNDEIRASVGREGAQLVDLDVSVPKNLTAFDDETTLTGAGHAAVADEVQRVLFGAGTARRQP